MRGIRSLEDKAESFESVVLFLFCVELDEVVKGFVDGEAVFDVHFYARVFEVFEGLGGFLVDIAEFGNFGVDFGVVDDDVFGLGEDLEDERSFDALLGEFFRLFFPICEFFAGGFDVFF